MSVRYGTINNRNLSMQNVREDCDDSLIHMRIDRLHECIDKEISNHNSEASPGIKRQMNLFIESIQTPAAASRYIDEAFELSAKIAKLDPSYSFLEISSITNLLLPYANVDALNRLNEKVEDLGLQNNQYERIKIEINENIVADRILANHEKISKRFNIEQEVVENSITSIPFMLEGFCDMINTYNMRPYQKLNVCIEELTYLLNKNAIDYDPSEMVAEVAKNMLLTNEVSLSELNGYRKALEESYVLDPVNDLNEVNYLFVDDYDYMAPCTIKAFIERFLLNPNKDVHSILKMNESVSKDCSLVDIRQHLENYFMFLEKCYKHDIIHSDVLNKLLENFVDNILERNISSTDIKAIIENCNSCFKNPILMAKYRLPDDQSKINVFTQYMADILLLFEDYQTIFYNDKNIEDIAFVSNFENTKEAVSLNEFKIFKFHNLVKAAFNLNKYIKLKTQRFLKKPKKKIQNFVRKARHILFGEATEVDMTLMESQIYDFIGLDHKADLCVYQIPFDYTTESEIKDFLIETCNGFNEQMMQRENYSIRCYYIMNPEMAEIHIKENTIINLTEEESEEIKHSIGSEVDLYVESFANYAIEMNNISDRIFSYDQYVKEFCENCEYVSEDMLNDVCQLMAYVGVEESKIQQFADTYYVAENRCRIQNREEMIDENRKINVVIPEDVDIECQLEAYDLMTYILEKGPEIKKPNISAPKLGKDKKGNDEVPKKDNTHSSDEQQKKTFGSTLNDVRLSIEGLKGKWKDMSQAEKEASRNLDNNVRRLAKGMKDALVSDRREAIIKGSVIPSFSKCLKIGISLAGLGMITANPAIPIITAVTGFFMSKHFTKRERMLLLDDIEIELEVIDKEIADAESKNQMKRYRALLKTKKDLQRQYQRIKYNVRIGKDIMSGSTVGMKKTD